MRPFRCSVSTGCNRIANLLVAGVVELEHSPGKHTLISTVTLFRDSQIAVQDNYFKIHFRRLHLVRMAFHRNQYFLDLYAGNADQETGFLCIRVHRFCGDGESIRAGSDLNRIAAVEVVVA